MVIDQRRHIAGEIRQRAVRQAERGGIEGRHLVAADHERRAAGDVDE